MKAILLNLMTGVLLTMTAYPQLAATDDALEGLSQSMLDRQVMLEKLLLEGSLGERLDGYVEPFDKKAEEIAAQENADRRRAFEVLASIQKDVDSSVAERWAASRASRLLPGILRQVKAKDGNEWTDGFDAQGRIQHYSLVFSKGPPASIHIDDPFFLTVLIVDHHKRIISDVTFTPEIILEGPAIQMLKGKKVAQVKHGAATFSDLYFDAEVRTPTALTARCMENLLAGKSAVSTPFIVQKRQREPSEIDEDLKDSERLIGSYQLLSAVIKNEKMAALATEVEDDIQTISTKFPQETALLARLKALREKIGTLPSVKPEGN